MREGGENEMFWEENRKNKIVMVLPESYRGYNERRETRSSLKPHIHSITPEYSSYFLLITMDHLWVTETED